MKVLILTQSYLPVAGGLQQIVHDLARGLLAHGHSVQVVTQRYPRTLPAHSTIDQIAVRRLLFISPSWRSLRRGRLDLVGFGLLNAPRIRRQLAHLISDFAPDVIHYHYPQTLNPFVLAVLNGSRTRLIVTFHGVEIDEAQRGSTADRNRLRAILARSDRVTAVSGAALEMVIAFDPSIIAKAHVVYNGVPDAVFEPPMPYHHARRYLLSAGRLVQPKGFDLLIDGFAQIAADYPHSDLILAGDGDYRAELEAQAARHGLSERVIFAGNVARAQLAGMIENCYFIVVPSRAETFGLFAVEAMALGRRVIASAVGGLPEIVGTSNSLSDNQLVAATADGIAAGLHTWLADPHFTIDSAVNRQQAERFRMETMINAYEQHYRPIDAINSSDRTQPR